MYDKKWTKEQADVLIDDFAVLISDFFYDSGAYDLGKTVSEIESSARGLLYQRLLPNCKCENPQVDIPSGCYVCTCGGNIQDFTPQFIKRKEKLEHS